MLFTDELLNDLKTKIESNDKYKNTRLGGFLSEHGCLKNRIAQVNRMWRVLPEAARNSQDLKNKILSFFPYIPLRLKKMFMAEPF